MLSTLWAALGLSRLWLYVVAALSFLATIGAVLLYVYSAGKNKVRLDNQKVVIQHYQIEAHAQDEVRRMSTAAARAKLRERWSRQ